MVHMSHFFSDQYATSAYIPVANIPIFAVAERLYNVVCYYHNNFHFRSSIKEDSCIKYLSLLKKLYKWNNICSN